MSERGPALTAQTEHSTPDRARARELFERLGELDPDSPERQRIRDELVELHLPLVEYLARRFRNRGEWLDDLTQVATIGLIKSIDRFDLSRGVEFSTYATPTIVGEIKRHFRDKGWAVRVPRRLQELKLSLTKAVSELSQRHGRAPTVAELAEYLKMSEEEVLEGLESANAYSTVSLDAPDNGDEDAPAVADSLGIMDESLEGVEYRESLKPLLERLPPREKKILLLERGGLVFAFNFNPEQSFDRYGFAVDPGEYETVLDSDAARYGGFARNDDGVTHFTVPESEGDTLYLYLPSRTVQVLRKKS